LSPEDFSDAFCVAGYAFGRPWRIELHYSGYSLDTMQHGTVTVVLTREGIETRVFKNPWPGEIRKFCQTRNPGLTVRKTRGFRVCIFAPRTLRLMEYYTILDKEA